MHGLKAEFGLCNNLHVLARASNGECGRFEIAWEREIQRTARKHENRGNKAKECLKTKDITFFNAANSAHSARNLSAIEPQKDQTTPEFVKTRSGLVIPARRHDRDKKSASVAPQKSVVFVSPSAMGVFDSWLGMLRAPKGRPNKAQANGLGRERDPIFLWEEAQQGRNNQALASAHRRLERLVTPLQGWPIARQGFLTQAVGLGFVRPPLWGLRISSARGFATHAVGYMLPPAWRAEFLNELLTQDAGQPRASYLRRPNLDSGSRALSTDWGADILETENLPRGDKVCGTLRNCGRQHPSGGGAVLIWS